MKDRRAREEFIVSVRDLPHSVTCPQCGHDIGLWTDSMLTICLVCGFHAFKKEAIIN